MRWIVSFVAAVCLLAASSARPDDRQIDGRDANQLTQVTQQAVGYAAARRTSSGGDLRLSPFTAPAVAVPGAPPDVACDASEGLSPEPPPARSPAVCSRGPPRG
jgi:hypothetical protein